MGTKSEENHVSGFPRCSHAEACVLFEYVCLLGACVCDFRFLCFGEHFDTRPSPEIGAITIHWRKIAIFFQDAF